MFFQKNVTNSDHSISKTIWDTELCFGEQLAPTNDTRKRDCEALSVHLADRDADFSKKLGSQKQWNLHVPFVTLWVCFSCSASYCNAFHIIEVINPETQFILYLLNYVFGGICAAVGSLWLSAKSMRLSVMQRVLGNTESEICTKWHMQISLFLGTYLFWKICIPVG